MHTCASGKLAHFKLICLGKYAYNATLLVIQTQLAKKRAEPAHDCFASAQHLQRKRRRDLSDRRDARAFQSAIPVSEMQEPT